MSVLDLVDGAVLSLQWNVGAASVCFDVVVWSKMVVWSFAFSANPESDINVWISTVVKVKSFNILNCFHFFFF